MKNVHLAIWLLATLLALAPGCGDLENLVENATERTITISHTIHDNTSERDVKSATFLEDMYVRAGQTRLASRASVADLAERIEVSRLGLADVRFFVSGEVENLGSAAAVVRLGALPAGSQSLLPIGSIHVPAGKTIDLTSPGQMVQDADAIADNLHELLTSLDAEYELTPVVQVEGGAQILVDKLRVAALPVYWKTKGLSEQTLRSYRENIKEIKNPQLLGSVSNEGGQLAEVTIYLGDGEAIDPTGDLLGYAVLAPGETMAGHELLVENGQARIKQAFKDLMDGQHVNVDFVVVSESPLTVKSRDLRLEITVKVQADIF